MTPLSSCGSLEELVSGGAVWRARAWLAMSATPQWVYADSVGCAPVQPRIAQPTPQQYEPVPASRNVDQAYRLMPNPAQDEVRIVWRVEVAADLPFALWDAYGRQVMQGTLAKGQTEHRINTAQLPSGVYFLQLAGIEKSKPHKVLIQR